MKRTLILAVLVAIATAAVAETTTPTGEVLDCMSQFAVPHFPSRTDDGQPFEANVGDSVPALVTFSDRFGTHHLDTILPYGLNIRWMYLTYALDKLGNPYVADVFIRSYEEGEEDEYQRMLDENDWPEQGDTLLWNSEFFDINQYYLSAKVLENGDIRYRMTLYFYNRLIDLPLDENQYYSRSLQYNGMLLLNYRAGLSRPLYIYASPEEERVEGYQVRRDLLDLAQRDPRPLNEKAELYTTALSRMNTIEEITHSAHGTRIFRVVYQDGTVRKFRFSPKQQRLPKPEYPEFYFEQQRVAFSFLNTNLPLHFE